MTSQRCLYTLIHAGRDRHEEILSDLVAPIVQDLRGSPDLDSLFFARYNDPAWHLRFRVLGRPDWVDGLVKRLIERRLEPYAKSGVIERHEFGEYDREYDRYGGSEGMALAEKLFLHDTIACLELIQAEKEGQLAKSRREISMVLTDRLLDLLRFDPKRRLEFYLFGYNWALSMETWKDDELRVLDQRFQALRPGLTDLLLGSQRDDPVAAFGSEEAARIAKRYLEAIRPIIEKLLAAHRAGAVKQDLVYLAWSYTHMQCNRLGIDPTPEAILRYFAHRLFKEAVGPPA